MRFFFDNNLSVHLAHGMREFGESVEHLKDRFSQDAADSEWLQYLGENDIVLVTRDEAIRWPGGAPGSTPFQGRRIFPPRQDSQSLSVNSTGCTQLGANEGNCSIGDAPVRDTRGTSRVQIYAIEPLNRLTVVRFAYSTILRYCDSPSSPASAMTAGPGPLPG
jgi:PIN like domain